MTEIVDETIQDEEAEQAARDAGLLRTDHPELDEALDPEYEPVFEVEVDPALEEQDVHEIDEALEAPGEGVEAPMRVPAPRASIQARSERRIPGMGGKVYDYRGTGLCPPNGSRIRPLVMVHHIPVVRNVAGTADLVTLGHILRGQGLAIQAGTDAEGNVALYTRFDQLCYGHKGANQLACGVEHMHMTIDEPWTERQMRAAAWCANEVWTSYGIPPRNGILLPGDGIVSVQRRGHVSHKDVSDKAGHRNRSDPGARFNRAHLYELTRFFNKNGRF